MAPHSPGTDQIDSLLAIGFVAAAILIIAINVALFYVVRKCRGGRDAEPASTPATAVACSSGSAPSSPSSPPRSSSSASSSPARRARRPPPAPLASPPPRAGPLTIKATGQQWLWRYDYPNGAFSYYKLVVPVDTAVKLELLSTDVVHTWDVPALSGKRDAVPGKTNKVVFRADEEGNYEGQSATLSGQAYAEMRTEVEVVSADAYEDFIKQQKSDIQTRPGPGRRA